MLLFTCCVWKMCALTRCQGSNKRSCQIMGNLGTSCLRGWLIRGTKSQNILSSVASILTILCLICLSQYQIAWLPLYGCLFFRSATSYVALTKSNFYRFLANKIEQSTSKILRTLESIIKIKYLISLGLMLAALLSGKVLGLLSL